MGFEEQLLYAQKKISKKPIRGQIRHFTEADS